MSPKGVRGLKRETRFGCLSGRPILDCTPGNEDNLVPVRASLTRGTIDDAFIT